MASALVGMKRELCAADEMERTLHPRGGMSLELKRMEDSPVSINSHPLEHPAPFSLSPLTKEFLPVAVAPAKPEYPGDAHAQAVEDAHMLLGAVQKRNSDADAHTFFAAVAKADVDVVMEMMLGRSLNTLTVQMQDLYGVSPLHVAAARGHLQLASMLLVAGADPNIEDFRSGYAPVDVAAGVGNTDMCVLLRSYGADCEEAYQIALDRGHTELAKRLVGESNEEGGIGDPTPPCAPCAVGSASAWDLWSEEQKRGLSDSIEHEVLRRAQYILHAN